VCDRRAFIANNNKTADTTRTFSCHYMPRVPKAPPAWISDFLTFVQRQEKDKKQWSANEKKKVLSLFEKHWPAFHTKAAEADAAAKAKKAGGPAKAKKTKDPMSTLETAIKQMNEKMVMEGNPEERQRLQDGLATAVQELVPSLKTSIAPAAAPSPTAAGNVPAAESSSQDNPEPAAALVVVEKKDPQEREALMSEATQVYSDVIAEIDSAAPPESATVVKANVDKLYDIAVRAITE